MGGYAPSYRYYILTTLTAQRPHVTTNCKITVIIMVDSNSFEIIELYKENPNSIYQLLGIC